MLKNIQILNEIDSIINKIENDADKNYILAALFMLKGNLSSDSNNIIPANKKDVPTYDYREEIERNNAYENYMYGI